MKKKTTIPGTYAELKHRVLLTGIRGVWRDLGNHKQYRAKNGAVLNWWESTGTITFQGRRLATQKLEVALAPAISICQSNSGPGHTPDALTAETNIVAKAEKAERLQAPQEPMIQTSTKTKRSVGILRKAKVTAKPLSPEFCGNLYLQKDTIAALAKQLETTSQAEVVCKITASVCKHEGGSDLEVEISPSYKCT
jgi:hypothetical protein